MNNKFIDLEQPKLSFVTIKMIQFRTDGNDRCVCLGPFVKWWLVCVLVSEGNIDLLNVEWKQHR